MAHTEVQALNDSEVSTPPRLLYNLNDKPPVKDALFAAFQHVCAIFIPVVTPGLLITGALGLDPNQSSYILGMSLFVSGLGTFIQVHQLGPVGSGLLAVQGTSFAFVTPILAVVTTSLQSGKTPEQILSLVMGLCFFGSFIPIILSRFLHLTRKIFTPLVTGTAVTLIGLCLIKVGMFYMAGGGKAKAIAVKMPDSPQSFGSLQNWALALTVFTIVGVCSASPNRYLRMGSVIIGLFVGLITSLCMGIADFSMISTLPIINVPIPFRFGLDFDLVTFIGFAVIYIALTLEVLGDITATSMVSGEPISGHIYMKRLKGGILGDGINSLMASILGSFPIVTPAQNNGIIQLTGVGSRYVGYYIAAILTFLGLFPVVGGVLLAIPTSVFGGAIMLMFGTVAVAGLNILREVEMDNRSFVILAISLAAGLGVTSLPESLEHFPSAVRSVLESGIATGSICALVLNLVVPIAHKEPEISEAEIVMESE
ncbi:xanthine permease [Pseudanabaena sp. lw0831]|uniref:uracil-xanthine permease family protein n=1 Tax=Pseudanabaena sp. lw0831 TaxID=1357935 RepID=UPI001916BFF4|nr:nucleobase:cation symporter-2 family protein [Pseudanabaena sp. lw0831]GBO56383.1 xanthine permease [Pseudanabaena sp. lw0831]